MERSRQANAEILAPRRVVTAPSGSRSNHDDAGHSSAEVETLYSHPDVKIISFAASRGKAGRATDGAVPDVLADEDVGTLSWSSRLERIIAVGPFRMYRALGSVAFLSCGSALQPILPKSQCWCIDQANSKFVLQIRRPNYWRIELPISNAEDRERARQLRHVLDGVLRFEKTQCPFRRSFTVALPETPGLPAVKRPWAPVKPDVPPAPGTGSNRAGDEGRRSCPAGSAPTISSSTIPVARPHDLPDERRGSVLAAAEAWEAACARLAGYAQTGQTPRHGDVACPSCQDPVASEMAASRDNQWQAQSPLFETKSCSSLDGNLIEPSNHRRGRRTDPLQPKLRHPGGFGIRSSSASPRQFTTVESPPPRSATARPSIHRAELSAEDSGSEDSFHSLQSPPLSCPASQSWSSATEACSNSGDAGWLPDTVDDDGDGLIRDAAGPLSVLSLSQGLDRAFADEHRVGSTATGMRHRAAISGSQARQAPMSPVLPPADVLSSPSALDPSQHCQTRVGMVRRLPIYIIAKTCEILLGPPSHLIALMLRVAARICAGEWRGQADGFGESGERIPVEWDYSNGELSDWTDDE